MKIVRTNTFKRDFQKLPRYAQEKFERKIRIFMKNIHHPSLRVKKMQGYKNRWEASIDKFYRFTFEVHEDYYLLRRIGPHDDILRSP
jgi:mRNA-degrading endonuclease YafQ of YafQ-DinJ toxin-antitoxin module